MRYKIAAVLIFMCLISISLVLFLNFNINKYIEHNYGLASSGEEFVATNDVIKNAEEFLEGGTDTQLLRTLKENCFNLTLVDMDGTIIFDSKDKNNLGKKNDINKLLAEVSMDRRIFTVSWKSNNGKESAMALVDNYGRKQGLKELENRISLVTWSTCLIFNVLILITFIIVYFNILYPFRKLKSFASEVAKGNLDHPLAQSRNNLFGAFSWAFDMMRNELKTSREREAEAVKAKKELVAVLSHDIRTPIAAIRAYAECLKGLTEKNSQRAERYIDVIIQKTDEITKLSQDMFLHAISDLEKLEITPGEYESRELLNNLIESLILQYDNRIIITSAIPEVRIYTDKLRLAQVFENIISNASKYAVNSDIEINAYIKDDKLICCFRDFGRGVQPEELPFIFDKFYRGKNAKESRQAGSGLGLYISKYILERTKAQVSAGNYKEMDRSGFFIEIELKII